MFIWDFIAEKIFDQLVDWIHSMLVGFLGEFFGMMNNMGAELFDFVWVKAIILFFQYLGWALFTVGFILTVFETAIAYQSGQGDLKGTFINIFKGFMATSLFTILPIELYKFAVTLQTSFSLNLASTLGAEKTIGEIANNSIGFVNAASLSGVFMIFLLIALGYAVIKVFFANLKRGGILLTQIAVGSLYMLSIPRGFTDGFIGWCKQVVAICLTTFLQSLFLIAGLMVFRDNLLLGIGLMMSANEIPRIADQFGLDTSTRGNMMGTIYATQSALNIAKTIIKK